MIRPSLLILVGLGGFALTNIVTFCINLFTALYRARGIEDEKELQARVGPALQGIPTDLGPRTARAVAALCFFFLLLALSGTA